MYFVMRTNTILQFVVGGKCLVLEKILLSIRRPKQSFSGLKCIGSQIPGSTLGCGFLSL